MYGEARLLSKEDISLPPHDVHKIIIERTPSPFSHMHAYTHVRESPPDAQTPQLLTVTAVTSVFSAAPCGFTPLIY